VKGASLYDLAPLLVLDPICLVMVTDFRITRKHVLF